MSGIIRGEFEENIFQAEADAAKLVKRPTLLDDFGGDLAANILARGDFDVGDGMAVRRATR